MKTSTSPRDKEEARRMIMRRIICLFFGHKVNYRLTYIYDVLPRTHGVCLRCYKTTVWRKSTEEEEDSLPVSQ